MSRETTIPLAFGKCEETGLYENFVMAAHPHEHNKVEGFTFDDTDVSLNMIPYYAWAHRCSGDMAVCLPIELNATKPEMAPTLASESKIEALHNVKPIAVINDGFDT